MSSPALIVDIMKKGAKKPPAPEMDADGDEASGVAASLGQAVVDAVKSGDGQAVYDALHAAVNHCLDSRDAPPSERDGEY